ncbi:MAG: ComF family protein [Rhizobiales bacterium]|nr:ComF family protein [Hyphomicrobiales bacterium]
MQFPSRLWRGVVDFITPPRCLSCRNPVGEPASLCAVCWPALRQIDDPVCEVTGTPFAYDQGQGAVSAAALANPPLWDRARGAVAFDEVSRALVHALKYHDTQEAGLLMSRMMARAGRALLAEADILVPVPLHRLRLWQRRFNQSSYLAQHLADSQGRAWRSDLLTRIKATKPQVGLDSVARRKNLKGAFHVAPERQALVAGRKILLVDDVLTTGATSGACAQALKQAGAARVNVLVFALVLEPARFHI